MWLFEGREAITIYTDPVIEKQQYTCLFACVSEGRGGSDRGNSRGGSDRGNDRGRVTELYIHVNHAHSTIN